MVKTASLLLKHSSLFAPVCDVMHVQLTKSTYRELKVECLIILAVVECDILLKRGHRHWRVVYHGSHGLGSAKSKRFFIFYHQC